MKLRSYSLQLAMYNCLMTIILEALVLKGCVLYYAPLCSVDAASGVLDITDVCRN